MNQLTGFYMRSTLSFNGLNKVAGSLYALPRFLQIDEYLDLRKASTVPDTLSPYLCLYLLFIYGQIIRSTDR